MKIKLYFSVLLLVLVIKNVSSNVRLQRSGSEKQYCGSKLTEIMKMVCNGSYLKRSEMDSETWDYKDLEDYNAIDYPYRSKREVMSFIPSRYLHYSKKRTGIVDECCKKACSINELKSYCDIKTKY